MRIDPARLGRWGEDLACSFLRLKGMRIVARNYRVGRYELDVIAADRDELVFVEVKVRTSEDCGGPVAAVGFKKQRGLARAAAAYVADRRTDACSFRFDVIGVVAETRGRSVTLQHIEGAFQNSVDGLFT